MDFLFDTRRPRAPLRHSADQTFINLSKVTFPAKREAKMQSLSVTCR
jgi:hypothetical protein